MIFFQIINQYLTGIGLEQGGLMELGTLVSGNWWIEVFLLGIGAIINLMDTPLRCASMSLCMGTIQLMSIFGVMLIAKFITDTSVK